jgi:hypothetical protein
MNPQRIQDTLEQVPFFARKRAVLLFVAPSQPTYLIEAGSKFSQDVSETVHSVMTDLNDQYQYMTAWLDDVRMFFSEFEFIFQIFVSDFRLKQTNFGWLLICFVLFFVYFSSQFRVPNRNQMFDRF